MRPLHVIQAERDEVQKLLEGNLATAKAENRSLTDEEKTKHQELMTKLKALNDEMKERQDYDVEVARATQLIYRPEQVAGEERSTPIAVTKHRQPGEVVARMVRCIAAGKNLGISPIAYAENTLKDEEVAKTLTAGSGPDGGFTVPEAQSSEVIELLRNRVAVRALGARTIPVPQGSLTMPGLAAGVSGGYVGEDENIAAEQQTYRAVKFTARKLACIIPLSNELIRFSSPSADTIARDDLIGGLAVTEDLHFLRGTGVGAGPKGLRYWANAGNVADANGTINLANVGADLGKLERYLQEGNIPMVAPGYIMAPRTASYLKELRDGNGNKAYPEMSASTPSLRGFPVRITNQVPINLGSGSNESELYFADFAQVLIGETMAITLAASGEASYWDGSTLQSAFARDLTLIRAITMHDLVARHDKAIAVLTAVKWGAS